MADVKADNLAKELVRLLNEMARLHEQLGALMQTKLEAIRGADSDAIESITARELMLANRVAEREGIRRDLVSNILRQMGDDGQKQRSLRISELAERFAEPRRSQILVAAAGLRARLDQIDRIRVTTTMITQEMLRHMNEIISVMTSGGRTTGVYSRAGNRETSGVANVFEAVG